MNKLSKPADVPLTGFLLIFSFKVRLQLRAFDSMALCLSEVLIRALDPGRISGVQL